MSASLRLFSDKKGHAVKVTYSTIVTKNKKIKTNTNQVVWQRFFARRLQESEVLQPAT